MSATRRVLAAAAVAVAVAGCGLGDREVQADLVRSSVDLAATRGAASGTIEVSVAYVDGPVEIPEIGLPLATVSSDFIVDFERRRSFLSQAQLLHEGMELNLRKADAEEKDARPWLSLRMDDLDPSAAVPFVLSQPLPTPTAAFALPLPLLFDMLRGALTGSLDIAGPATIGGDETIEYVANFGIGKMLGEADETYDDDAIDDVNRVLDLMHLTDDVNHARVWLTDDGMLRRFQLEFAQRPRRSWRFDVTITVDVTAWGTALRQQAPSAEEVIRVNTFARLLSSLDKAFGISAPGIPGGITVPGAAAGLPELPTEDAP